MSQPFFSICIPAYNCGDIIYEALESVASQTFADWEVVVFDDGSSDDTVEVCRNQGIIPHDHYTFAAGRHGGLLLAREQLAKRARGHVIVSLDADDTFASERALQEIHDAFERTQCDVVAFNATRSMDTLAPFVDYSVLSTDSAGHVDVDAARATFCTSYSLNNVAFKAYKKSVMDFGSHIPELSMTEDRYQAALLFSGCQTMTLIDKPLYYYRINPHSVTESPFRLSFFQDQMLVERMVAGLAARWGVAATQRERFLADVLFYDITAITRTVPSAHERLSLFSKIRDDDDYARVYGGRLATEGIRADKSIALSAFDSRKFRLLDAFMGLRNCVSGIAHRHS